MEFICLWETVGSSEVVGVAIEAQLSCDSLGVKERAEVYVSSSSDASSTDVCMVTELLGVGG